MTLQRPFEASPEKSRRKLQRCSLRKLAAQTWLTQVPRNAPARAARKMPQELASNSTTLLEEYPQEKVHRELVQVVTTLT